MTKLTAMKNIGAEMERKLRAVGIDTPEKLLEAGAEGAFFQLKTLFPKVCLVHLYALEGAILNLDYNRLPPDRVRALKAFSDYLKG
ncbi:MAG: hypothetical protein HFF30_00210 [Flavonifractor sp.]|jgi:DNA transformation protein|nr:hypothetical protein [Flavonifractor sp.]MCI9472593.1 hypothetical protein [Flavonifractor sp.]